VRLWEIVERNLVKKTLKVDIGDKEYVEVDLEEINGYDKE